LTSFLRARPESASAEPAQPRDPQPAGREVERVGKGKPRQFYEFCVKVSVATTLKRFMSGQFPIHVQALTGNPYDGHTLARIIPAIEQRRCQKRHTGRRRLQLPAPHQVA
jgi:hypothetical protein